MRRNFHDSFNELYVGGILICYLGDPYSHDGCNKKVVTSCMTGDPHYYSFDRNFFDYQGTCPYIVSKNCKSIAPYADFVIKARNALVRPAAQ